MASLSSLGIGLSLVFSCLLLALIAELYYLLWWKKRGRINEELQDDYSSNSSSAREFMYLFCWKKPSSLSSTGLNPQELSFNSTNEQDLEQSNSTKELYLNSYGDDSIEAELMRLHNLAGPPRLLFTINEETKEDLESEDGRSRMGDKNFKVSRTLGDLLLSVETPFLTPMASPRLSTSTPPCMTPIMNSLNNQYGFNPLFESSVDPEMYKIGASPPPKFKFLIEAEEKLYKRRLIEEAMKRVQRNSSTSIEDYDKIKAYPSPSLVTNEEEDGSFIRIIVDNNNVESTQIDHHHHSHYHSCSSQILPLSSSPSSTRTPNKNPP